MNQHSPAFWSVPASDQLQQLGATPLGLTNTEARLRLARFGANLLTPKKRTDQAALHDPAPDVHHRPEVRAAMAYFSASVSRLITL